MWGSTGVGDEKYQKIQLKNCSLGFHSFSPNLYFNIVEEGLVQESFIIYPDHDLRILRADKLNDNNQRL